jgi:hypothetical protein
MSNAPWLQRDVLAGVIQQNVAAALDEFPVLNLFLSTTGGSPRMVPGELVTFDTEYNEKRLAGFHAQPGIADRVVHTREGKIIVQMIYQQVKDSIRPNDLARFRMPGMSAEDVYTSADVNAMVNKKIEKLTRAILRQREQDCCSLISSASYTRTVDGVANTITTGLTLNATAPIASWATASTDIPAALGAMYEAFVDQAGADPTHVVMSFLAWSNLAKNDKIREFAIRGNSGGGLIELPLNLISNGVGSINVLVHKAHYKTDAGSKTYYWAEDRMTFLDLSGGEDVLGTCTCPLILPDKTLSTESISTHTWCEDETGEHWVKVQGVFAPYLGDLDKILAFDLTP